MAIPGFNAEATLYNSPAAYRRAASGIGSQVSMTTAVVPALPRAEYTGCALALARAYDTCTAGKSTSEACLRAAGSAVTACRNVIDEILAPIDYKWVFD
jgi:hypothetical protein